MQTLQLLFYSRIELHILAIFVGLFVNLVEWILTGGSGHDELVEGHAFTSSLDDFGSGGLSESEGGDGHLGEIEDSEIISDGSDNNSDFVPAKNC